MSHLQRIQWLTSHGYNQTGSFEVPELGTSLWINGVRQGLPESFWLSCRDGRAIVHGETSPVKSWEQLQDWIEAKPQEPKKILRKERNLFGDEE